jgi:serine/threonine protein kinase
MTEETLFELAVNTPEAQRAALLDRECAGDPGLRARIEELLRADGGTLAFVPAATLTVDPAGTRSHHPTEPVGEAGQMVGGKYKLLDVIGEGGMGSVWRAQQTEPVKRLVAVKLIKAGMDSKAVLARFEAERQALAVMDHPNIAKILDGGLHENRPFFVMELVKGVPITEFCDVRKLTPKQRLELFLPVCSAIQPAHMKGIIHRDIKPSNVIVALYDDKPIPKVIDFGIAKATGGSLTDGSYLTAFGGVVGTPQYMSPEQASLNNLDIDTRSDVYSLGVLLYELLAGSPPFAKKELENAGLMEILRVVREEEPPRPSTKLSTADAKASISANRGSEPVKLAVLLKGELDWIVMRALEKDRTRRYESANSFAADVKRYLCGEQVLAVPPSVGYRVKKFIRRNQSRVVAASLLIAALLAGITGTTWGLFEARREAERVRQEQIKTKEALELAERNRDQAELNLVHSYLRPIGFNTEKFDQAELIALDELSRQEDDRIKVLFIREALADGERSLRVARRAERVIQATVGPSLKRRESILELCRIKKKDNSADPLCKLCAFWLSAALENVEVTSLNGHFDTLKFNRVQDWDNFFDSIPDQAGPAQASELFKCFLTELGTSSIQPKGRRPLGAVEFALKLLVPRIDQTTATFGATSLADYIRNHQDLTALFTARDILVDLASQLDPAIRMQIAESLVVTIQESSDRDRINAARDTLSAFCRYVDSNSKVQILESIFRLSYIKRDTTLLYKFREALDSNHVEFAPSEVLQTVEFILASIHNVKEVEEYDVANTLLETLGSRMNAATAKKVWDVMSAASEKVNQRFILKASVAARLAPIDLHRAANLWISMLKETDEESVLDSISAGLGDIAPKLDPALAKKAFDALLPVYPSILNWGNRSAEAESLVALAKRIDTEDLDKVLQSKLKLLSSSSDEKQLFIAVRVLTALAPKLNKSLVRNIIVSFSQLQKTCLDTNVQYAIFDCLQLLVPQQEIATIKLAFETCLHISIRQRDSSVDYSISDWANELLRELDTASIRHVVMGTISSLNKTVIVKEQCALLSVLASLTPRLESSTATTTANACIELFNNSKDPLVKSFCADVFVVFAPRLDAQCRRQIVVALIANLDIDDSKMNIDTINCLAKLAPWFSVECARMATETLFDVLLKTTKRKTYNLILERLCFLVDELPIHERKLVFEKILSVFATSAEDHESQIQVIKCLSSLTLKIDAPIRSQYCEQSVEQIVKYSRIHHHRFFRIYDINLIRHLNSISLLVDLLKQPAVLASSREAVIIRLEELAYPNSDFSLITQDRANVFACVAGAPAAFSAERNRHANRKFRTLEDATKWLAENHPEIDLDKPYAQNGK